MHVAMRHLPRRIPVAMHQPSLPYVRRPTHAAQQQEMIGSARAAEGSRKLADPPPQTTPKPTTAILTLTLGIG